MSEDTVGFFQGHNLQVNSVGARLGIVVLEVQLEPIALTCLAGRVAIRRR